MARPEASGGDVTRGASDPGGVNDDDDDDADEVEVMAAGSGQARQACRWAGKQGGEASGRAGR